MKKLAIYLQLALLCIFSFSCVLDVAEPSSKGGELTFVLPEAKPSRVAVNGSPSMVSPDEYSVQVTYLDVEKVVYDKVHKAGDKVEIPDLEYGMYDVSVTGTSSTNIFSDTKRVEVFQEVTKAEIKLKAEKLYANVEVHLPSNASSYSSFYYTVQSGSGKPLNYDGVYNASTSSFLIQDLYVGKHYNIEVFAKDSNYSYKGKIAQTEVNIVSGKTTSLDVTSFEVNSGSIELTSKVPVNNCVVSVIDTTTNEQVARERITSLESSFVIKYIPEGVYNVVIASDDPSLTYSVKGTVNVTKGKKVGATIVDTPLTTYYVSRTGLDTNLGIMTSPLRTVKKAIEKSNGAKDVTVIIEGEINEDILIDKEINLTLQGKTSSKRDSIKSSKPLTISNALSNVTVQGLKIDSSTEEGFALNDGFLTLGTDAFVTSLFINLDKFVTISGEISNSLSDTVNIKLSRYSNITNPIIKVSNGMNLGSLVPKFVLIDPTYVLSPSAVPVLKVEGLTVHIVDYQASGKYTINIYKDIQKILSQEATSDSTIIYGLGLNDRVNVVVEGELNNIKYEGRIDDITITDKAYVDLTPTSGALTLDSTMVSKPLTSSFVVKMSSSDGTSKEVIVPTLPYTIPFVKEGSYTFSVTGGKENEGYEIHSTTVTNGSVSNALINILPLSTYYVDSINGDDNTASGIEQYPYRTVKKIIEVNSAPNMKIVLKGDVEETIIEIPEGKNVTIDGQNHTLASFVTVNGSLTLKNTNVTLPSVGNPGDTAITVDLGKLILEEGCSVTEVNLLNGTPIAVKGTLSPSNNTEVHVPVYSKGIKVIDLYPGFASEKSKFRLRDTKYQLDANGNIDSKIISYAVTITNPSLTNTEYSITDMKGQDVNGANPKTFSGTSFNIDNLESGASYKLVVKGKDTDFLYKWEGVITIDTSSKELTLEKASGTLQITSNTATAGSTLTVTVDDGLIDAPIEETITSFPHTIKYLEPTLNRNGYSVTISNSSGEEKYSYTPSAKIEKNKTATIDVTATVAQNKYYVNDTTGDDASNPGTKAAPYKTLGAVVNLINGTVEDSGTVFTINLTGTISEKAQLNVAKPYTYIIQGEGGNAATVKAIASSGDTSLPSDHRVMFIDNDSAKITLKNLTLTGGNPPSSANSGQGGCLYINKGEVILEDGVAIIGNKAADGQFGGAVYLSWNNSSNKPFTMKNSCYTDSDIWVEYNKPVTTENLTHSPIAGYISFMDHGASGTTAISGSVEDVRKFRVVDSLSLYGLKDSGELELLTIGADQAVSILQKGNTVERLKVGVDDAGLATLLAEINKGTASIMFLDLTPSTFTEIPANSAFSKLTDIYQIDLPASLGKIGANAFKGTGSNQYEKYAQITFATDDKWTMDTGEVFTPSARQGGQALSQTYVSKTWTISPNQLMWSYENPGNSLMFTSMINPKPSGQPFDPAQKGIGSGETFKLDRSNAWLLDYDFTPTGHAVLLTVNNFVTLGDFSKNGTSSPQMIGVDLLPGESIKKVTAFDLYYGWVGLYLGESNTANTMFAAIIQGDGKNEGKFIGEKVTVSGTDIFGASEGNDTISSVLVDGENVYAASYAKGKNPRIYKYAFDSSAKTLTFVQKSELTGMDSHYITDMKKTPSGQFFATVVDNNVSPSSASDPSVGTGKVSRGALLELAVAEDGTVTVAQTYGKSSGNYNTSSQASSYFVGPRFIQAIKGSDIVILDDGVTLEGGGGTPLTMKRLVTFNTKTKTISSGGDYQFTSSSNTLFDGVVGGQVDNSGSLVTNSNYYFNGINGEHPK